MNDYEYEIDLIDLFYHILRRWKSVIALGLIGAILLGGYDIYTQFRPYLSEEEKQLANEEVLEKLKVRLTDMEIEETEALAESYESYVYTYEEKSRYGENSIWLNMEPEHVYKGTATYLISDYYDNKGQYVVENNDAGNIVALYRSLILDDMTVRFINNVTGWNTEPKYIRELISVSNSGVSLLMLTAAAPTEDECKKMLTVLENRLTEVCINVVKDVPHKIEIVNEVYTNDYDTALLEAKKSQSDILVSLKNTMRKLGEPLSVDQKAYYDELIRQSHPDEEKEKEFSKRSFLKKFIIGGVGLVFLYLLIICCMYLFKQVLKTAGDISALTGINAIGIIRSSSDKNGKKANKIDELIEKSYKKHNGILAEDTAYALVASNIVATLKKDGICSLLITGSISSDETDKVRDKVRDMISADDMAASASVSVTNSVLTDAESFRIFTDSDAVVLIEKVMGSQLSDIRKEAELCRKYGVKLLGTVVVG